MWIKRIVNIFEEEELALVPMTDPNFGEAVSIV